MNIVIASRIHTAAKSEAQAHLELDKSVNLLRELCEEYNESLDTNTIINKAREVLADRALQDKPANH